MDDEIDNLVIAAWRRVRERLRDRPAEVLKRLRRGREMVAKRPPRAWCLVVRASDQRITPMTARCVPEEAAYPRECLPPHRRTVYERHTVTLDVELLRALCSPVWLEQYGEPIADVARKVGRSKDDLHTARAVGAFSSRYYPQGGGRGGTPTAILSAKRWLDPSAHLCTPADRVWGWTGKLVAWRVPDELAAQAIVRVPIYYDRNREFVDKSGLHPEHPLVDRVRKKRPVRKIAPPPPDFVQYKWKGDQYLGYDWRNPLAKKGYERHERNKAYWRAYHKKRNACRPSQGDGSLKFRGWMWLCPICGKRKKVLYCPLPPVNVLRGVGCLIEDEVIDAAVAAGKPMEPLPPRGFGCVRCHRVHAFSRVSAGGWNAVVCYLSGGLLYGNEVPRPSWLTRERKRQYVPHPNMPLPRRPAEVQALLLKGMKYEQIGRELGITPKSARTYAGKIYKQHGVHGRAELARKLGMPDEPLMSKRARVHARVAAGQSTAQIARETGIARDMVATYVYRFRRANRAGGAVVSPRKREACSVPV